METQHFSPPDLEQVPTWQLPRRFDVVVWFARFQKMQLLNEVRLDLPGVGPAVAFVKTASSNKVENALKATHISPYTKPEFLGKTAQIWFPHQDYLESFTAWEQRNKHLNTRTAALTWIMSLPEEAWSALLCLLLDNKSATPEVTSAIVTLFLAIGDVKYLAHVKDEHIQTLHQQVYADDLGRGLYWLESWKPELLKNWIQTIKQAAWGLKIWYRLPISTQEYFQKYE